MIGSALPVLLIDLQPHDACGRLTVTLGSYLDFADDMSAGIEVLVERWKHQAPPRALVEALWSDRDDMESEDMEDDE